MPPQIVWGFPQKASGMVQAALPTDATQATACLKLVAESLLLAYSSAGVCRGSWRAVLATCRGPARSGSSEDIGACWMAIADIIAKS